MAVFFTFAIFINVECYAESSDGSQALTTAIDEIINGLDLTDVEDAFSDIDFFGAFDARNEIRNYLGGQTDFDLNDVFDILINAIFGSIKEYLPELLAVMAIAVFGCILDALKPTSPDASVSQIGFFAVNALTIGLVSSIFFSVFSVAKIAIESMTGQIQAVFPVILTLITAAGANGTATSLQPSVAYVCSIESVIAEKILFPITVTIFLFGAVNSLTLNSKLSKISDFFKSCFKWITGASSVIFTFFISAKSVAASTFDGFSIKALKYVVGNGVPIVSQIVNGGFDIVFASCVLVKNSLGLLALVALVATVFSPLIKIVVCGLFIRFAAAAIQPVSDERIVRFMTCSADALNYLSAILISIAVVYFITVFVTVCSLGVSV